MKSEDLLASVFPDQVACLENIVGEREIPDHPLVAQTLHDCLHEAMDIDGLLGVLQRPGVRRDRMLARDLPAPSPLAAGVLNAAPYAFLDDAPLEERRTQAVQTRRWQDPDSADDLAALDPRPSPRCAPKPGPTCAMPTRCTRRCSGSARSPPPKPARDRRLERLAARAGEVLQRGYRQRATPRR